MKKILAVILALAMVLALAACGAAPTTAEPTPEAPDPLKSEMPSKIYEESAAANPEGKTVNILLVIDMQKDFVDQALGTAEAQAIVPNVVAKINEYKERGDVIIATKDTHEESYLETQEGVNLPFIHCMQKPPQDLQPLQAGYRGLAAGRRGAGRHAGERHDRQ